jgi:hypothetical protein
MSSKPSHFDTQTSATPEDLSEQIVQLVDRLPGDRVTCRHIVGDHYRCNWWHPQNMADYDNPKMSGLLVTTHRVRQSQFLRAIKTEGRLKTEQVRHCG